MGRIVRCKACKTRMSWYGSSFDSPLWDGKTIYMLGSVVTAKHKYRCNNCKSEYQEDTRFERGYHEIPTKKSRWTRFVTWWNNFTDKLKIKEYTKLT